MDKKSDIVNMVEEVYVQCVIDYLYVIVKDAWKVAIDVQKGESCFQQDE